MQNSLQFLILAVVTSAAGIAMVRLGIKERMLDLRPAPDRCGTCGRRVGPRGCAHCLDR